MGKRIAVVTMGVKLGDEVKGYTRFLAIASMLAARGHEVDLITTSFQHWDKAQRDTERAVYHAYPFRVTFIPEPGYQRNVDPVRIWSHGQAAKNLRGYFDRAFSRDARAYDLIYAEIPPNDVARVCAEEAQAHGIPFVVDVNDLWPEAMRMALDIPVVSDILFSSFTRDARQAFRLASAAVGTSDEYAQHPCAFREEPLETLTVYVGNDLAAFDEGVRTHAAKVQKPEGELWVTYAGTLGASYDLDTLIKAAVLADEQLPDAHVRVKILGDGPERECLQSLVQETAAPVDILGYVPYDEMAAWLSASDILVNSLVASAPQSIVTKIGDYLAAGRPLINTGTSPEFRAKVETDGIGVNVQAENVPELAAAIIALSEDEAARTVMGKRARSVAERQFDRAASYIAIMELIERLADSQAR